MGGILAPKSAPQGLHFGSILAPKSAPLGEAPGPAQYPNEYSAKLWGAGFSLKKLVRAPPGLDFGPRKSLAWSLPKASLLDPPRPLFWSDFRCFFRPPNRPPKSSRLAKKASKTSVFVWEGTQVGFLGLPAGCLGGPFWRAFLSHVLRLWELPGRSLWGTIFLLILTSKSAPRRPPPRPPPTSFFAKIQPRTL